METHQGLLTLSLGRRYRHVAVSTSGAVPSSVLTGHVSNPSLFFAIAGISMSFAGFAGLFLALRSHETGWQRYELGQLNAIITFSLTSLFSALVIVPMASILGEAVALRALSAVVLVLSFYAHQVRIGTSWLRWSRIQSDLPRRAFVIGTAVFAAVAIVEQVLLLVNVVAPSQDLYGLALIAMLGTPALVFAWVVSRMGAAAQH